MAMLFAVFDLDDDNSASCEVYGWARDGSPMVIDMEGKRLVAATRFRNYRGLERAGRQEQPTVEPKAEHAGEIVKFDGSWIEV